MVPQTETKAGAGFQAPVKEKVEAHLAYKRAKARYQVVKVAKKVKEGGTFNA
jgi:hypothetical protein